MAAYEEGDAWLDALLRHVDPNHALLAALLVEQLPQVAYARP